MNIESNEHLRFDIEHILPVDVAYATKLYIEGKMTGDEFYTVIKACKGSAMDAGFEKPFGYLFGFLDKELKPEEKFEETKQSIDFASWEYGLNSDINEGLTNLVSTEQAFLGHSKNLFDRLRNRILSPRTLRPLNESEKAVYIGSRIMQLPPEIRGQFQGNRPPTRTEEGGDIHLRYRREAEHHETFEKERTKQEVTVPELIERHLAEMLHFVIEAANKVSPELKDKVINEYNKCDKTAREFGRENLWKYFQFSAYEIIAELPQYFDFPANAEDILRIHGRLELMRVVSYYLDQCQDGELDPKMYGDINQEYNKLADTPAQLYFDFSQRGNEVHTAMHYRVATFSGSILREIYQENLYKNTFRKFIKQTACMMMSTVVNYKECCSMQMHVEL